MKTRLLAGMFLTVMLSISGIVSAQPAEKAKRIVKTLTNEITGTISDIRKDFITVVYGRDAKKSVEYEILVPIDTGVEIRHKKSLQELRVGDTVSVIYDEVVLEDENKTQTTKRDIKVIRYVRSGEMTQQQPVGPSEPGEGLPDDIVPGQ